MIVCVGDNCVDYYDKTGEAFPGGNPVNVAVYIKRLGGDSAYIGAVGTDSFGKLLVEKLKEKKVDISRLHIEEGNTALTHVDIVEGDRVFGDYDEGVMEDFRVTPEDIAFIAANDIMVTGLWGHTENDLEAIKNAGGTIAFDCSDRPEDPVAQTALPFVDIAFFSEDSLGDEELQGKIISVAKKGPGIVIATRGANGCMAYAKGEFTGRGAEKCTVVDTMGAGDSFIAGFLKAYLAGEEISDCLNAGTASSVITLGYSGAWN